MIHYFRLVKSSATVLRAIIWLFVETRFTIRHVCVDKPIRVLNLISSFDDQLTVLGDLLSYVRLVGRLYDVRLLVFARRRRHRFATHRGALVRM